jgi:hypothetical protein
MTTSLTTIGGSDSSLPPRRDGDAPKLALSKAVSCFHEARFAFPPVMLRTPDDGAGFSHDEVGASVEPVVVCHAYTTKAVELPGLEPTTVAL